MGAMPGEQTQSLLQADATDRYLASRADTMQNIESTIVELGGIFQQLAHMLKEQEEMMVRNFTSKKDSISILNWVLAVLAKQFRLTISHNVSCIHCSTTKPFNNAGAHRRQRGRDCDQHGARPRADPEVLQERHVEPVAHGQGLRSAHILLHTLCRLHGVKTNTELNGVAVWDVGSL